MTTTLKLLEAKKAKILKEAQNATAEIDRDIEKLQELVNKYGLNIVEARSSKLQGFDVSLQRTRKQGAESAHRQASREVEEILQAAGRPVPLDSLYNSLIQKGIKLGGRKPRSTLCAYLSRNNNVESIRKGWWWFRGRPIPASNAPRKQSAS